MERAIFWNTVKKIMKANAAVVVVGIIYRTIVG